MFRVPIDPHNPYGPTYRETVKVSFWRWLISTKSDRKKWQSLRRAAHHTYGDVSNERAAQWAADVRARRARKDQ
jgi:hypothetical protein